MKILHVLDHSIPLHSGYTFRTRAILREQHARGWQTVHVTSEKQENCHCLFETVDGLDFYRTPAEKGVLSKIPLLNQWAVVKGLKKRLYQVVREVKPDVLHAHSPSLNGLAALAVSKEFGIPLVYEVRAFWEDAAVDHGSCREGDVRYRITRALESFVLRKADAVTTICEGLRADMVGRGIPEQKITVIPNAVDVEQFQWIDSRDQALAERLGVGNNPVVGFIGSFYAYEGLELILDAVPSMAQRYPNLQVLMVGGGFQDEALRAQAKRLGIEERVLFTGRVPHAEVDRYYSLIDVLIYPRRSKRITELVTPLKPLEAMAQGSVFVASDVGGHRELVDHGKNGWLFKSDDADALAEAALHLLGNDSLREDLRRAGHQFVTDVRNWKNSVANYQPIYDRLVGCPA